MFTLICFVDKPNKSKSHSIPTVIVGCKLDLGDERRMVTKYEGQEFAITHGARLVYHSFSHK